MQAYLLIRLLLVRSKHSNEQGNQQVDTQVDVDVGPQSPQRLERHKDDNHGNEADKGYAVPNVGQNLQC